MSRPWIVWGTDDAITIIGLHTGGMAPYGLVVEGSARQTDGGALPSPSNIHHRADEEVQRVSEWRVLVGDVREKLAELPDASVQCCVTSPPYWGLRDYGHAGQLGLEKTPDAYVAAMAPLFASEASA